MIEAARTLKDRRSTASAALAARRPPDRLADLRADPKQLPSDAEIPPGEVSWTSRPPLRTFEWEKEIPIRETALPAAFRDAAAGANR